MRRTSGGRAPVLGDLAVAVPVLPESTPALDVEAMFRVDPELRRLVFRRGDGRLALLTREEFAYALTGPLGFGRSLYANRSVAALLPADTLVLPPTASLQDASDAMRARPAHLVHVDVVVAPADASGPVAVAPFGPLLRTLA